MRRNLNSGKSVYLILLVAFFTLTSYFFDQLVIRKEDNLRNLKNKKYPFWRIDTYFSNLKETSLDIIGDGGWHFTNI